jgi:hypothetical protein
MWDPLHKWEPGIKHENRCWYYKRFTVFCISQILFATQA